MQKIFIVATIIIIVMRAGSGEAHAFSEETTHPALTQEIVNFYNLRHPDTSLSAEEKAAMMEGSKHEDTPPRWVNHFYDPVHRTGWTGKNLGVFSSSTVRLLSALLVAPEKPMASPLWVHDETMQNKYLLYGGNNTWEQGVRAYAAGDTLAAYRTLGHVLHLLEDLGVPDHTRDDIHAHQIGFLTGDPGSPHEAYAARWSPSTIRTLEVPEKLRAARRSVPSYADVADYFTALATYTNNHFFSKDTIASPDFPLPLIKREDDAFGYGVDEEGKEIPLVSVERTWESPARFVKTYELKEREAYTPLFDAYFSRIAPQIVLSGTGIIELFVNQGEEARRAATTGAWYGSLLSKFSIPMISPLGAIASVKSGIAHLFGKIGGSFGKNETFMVVPQNAVNITSTPSSTTPKTTSSIVRSIPTRKISKKSSVKTTVPKTTTGTPKSAPTNIVAPSPKPPMTAPPAPATSTTKKAPSTQKPQPSPAPRKPQPKSVPPPPSAQQPTIIAPPSTPPSSTPQFWLPLVISEVQVAGIRSANDEFIELYNPHEQTVPLGEWSIQYLSGAASSFEQIKKKNFENDMEIKPHHYFLFARGLNTNGEDGYLGSPAPDLTQRTFSLSGEESGGAIFLVRDQSTITSASDPEIVDAMGYGENTFAAVRTVVPEKGKSIERRALVAGVCRSAQREGEFDGNACDTNSTNDFDVRDIPQPQNNKSLAEPRTGTFPEDPQPELAPGGFTASYVSSSFSVHFAWDAPQQSAGSSSPREYRLLDLSGGHEQLLFKTTSTQEYDLDLVEAGRGYMFGLDAGNDRAVATSSIVVPGFLSGVDFYRRPAEGSTHYAVDILYDRIPFIPLRFSNPAMSGPSWQGIVFYQNRTPNLSNRVLTTTHDFAPEDMNGVITMNIDHFKSSIVFAVHPDFVDSAGGGLAQTSFLMPAEDGRLALTLSSTSDDIVFDEDDYLTLAYYDFSRVGGGTQDLSLVAIDQTKYYFASAPPARQAPTVPQNLTITASEGRPEASLRWSSSTDPDSIDSTISYEFAVASSSAQHRSWHTVANAISTTVSILSDEHYFFAIRAVDETGNSSDPQTLEWQSPVLPQPLPEQGEHAAIIGTVGSGEQKIVLPRTATIVGVGLWTAKEGGNSCCAASSLAIHSDDGGIPGAVLATSTVVTIPNTASNEERTYSITVTLEKNIPYWIVPSYVGFNGTRVYGALQDAYEAGYWSVSPSYDAYFRLLE